MVSLEASGSLGSQSRYRFAFAADSETRDADSELLEDSKKKFLELAH